ncbi:hypothetical protein AGENTSMITH_84 [Bacillus phage vB_BspM_AgentSmith]|nr:hypothetical protein AGENTSMITH_84 [Bacillus phage vB_BspM_AgentSmith]
MTTFILKKYEEKTEEAPQSTEGSPEGTTSPPVEEQQVTINVDASVAEIVAKTLLEVLGNRATIQQLADKNKEEQGNNPQARVVTTESINNDPIATLRSVSPNDILLISNEGFHTEKEEWFLTNVTNKTPTVFYSVESFVKHISSLFQESSVEG